MKLSQAKQETLNNIVEDLTGVQNIAAIALGGSYATGKANETSDLDIGIYYFDQRPFSIDEIKSIANKYSASENLTVTGFYEWGPWVNGGAWIETASGKVDFLYKNIEHVTSTIENAKNGIWENDFEQQPPFGFSSIIYLAETQVCIPLYDPAEIIAKLKKEVQVYPPKLKESVIQQSLWSAEFTIWHADHFFRKQDFFSIIGCLTRAVKYLTTTLFAINELYPMGDKRAIEILEKATKRPARLAEKIENILSVKKETINNNIDLLKAFFSEIIEMTNGTYKQVYKLRKA